MNSQKNKISYLEKRNRNVTLLEYIELNKRRMHKCREGWPAVLNKLCEHSINLGLGMETAWRDYEGTSVIFTSNGHNGPASECLDFDR